MKRGLAIDLGTANTLVYYKGVGIVIDEPSVVAVNKETHEVLAVGEEAKQMIGRTPENIEAVRPMKDGVIADYQATRAMLEYFIHKVIKQGFLFKPDLVICVPYGVTEVEKRALMDIALKAGTNERGTYLIEEPMAAAVGAGLPVERPEGSMVVDIGGGTSEVAVISLGGIVCSRSLRVAGDAVDHAIESYLQKAGGMMIGERTAEQVKISIGSAYVDDKTIEEKMTIKGRDALNGMPKTMEVTNFQIAEAIYAPIREIIDAILGTLEMTPPELAADIYDHGICLTGGGAMLKGLPTMIEKATGLHVEIAEDPLECVVRGTGMVLENPDQFQHILLPVRMKSME